MHTTLLFLFVISFIIDSHAQSDFGFQFIGFPEWYLVKPGDQIRLTCETNLRADRLVWHHNHEAILPNTHVKIKAKNKRHTSLILKVPIEEDLWKSYVGIYQCIASVGSVSIVSLPDRLEIAYMKPFPSVPRIPQTLTAPEDGWSIVSCKKPDSLPEASLTFYKDGEKMFLENSTEYLLTGNGDLIIRRSTLDTVGTFTCEAHNSLLNQVQKNPAEIKLELTSKVVHPEQFNMLFEERKSVRRGTTVKVMCLPYGQGNTPIKWVKTTPTESQTLETQAPVISERVTERTNFKCITNYQGKVISSLVTVELQERPSLRSTKYTNSISEGSTMTLACVFHGTPAPSITWVFNGQFLNSFNNVYINETQITISNIDRNQAGVYQCFAFNPLGSDFHTFMVVVVPDTVTARTNLDLDASEMRNKTKKVSVNATEKKENRIRGKKWTKYGKAGTSRLSRPLVNKTTSESAFVGWDEEIDHNVLFYKVQYKDVSSGSKSDWKTVDEYVPNSQMGLEVTGLVPGREYRFRVAAVYENNDHKFSSSSKKFLLKKTVHLKEPSHPPELFDSQEIVGRAVRVLWRYDVIVETEGFILYYRKTKGEGEYTEIVILGGDKRSYELDMLEKHVMYTVQMSSFNMAGRSPRSELFFATLGELAIKESQGMEDRAWNESHSFPSVTTRSTMLPNFYLCLLMIILGLGLCVALLSFSYCYLRQKKTMRQLREQDSCRCQGRLPDISNNNNDPMLNKTPSSNKNNRAARNHAKKNTRVKTKMSDASKESPSEYDRFICKMNL